MAGDLQSLIALDLATRLGWSTRDRYGKIHHGAEQLPPAHGEDYGRLFNSYRGWLRGMIAIDRPDVIWFERAQTNEHSSQAAAMILTGLVAHTLEIAYERKIPWRHKTASTIRKHFCGDGHAKKDDVGARCRAMGFEVSDHNECDALAVLHYAMAHPVDLSAPLLFAAPGRAA